MLIREKTNVEDEVFVFGRDAAVIPAIDAGCAFRVAAAMAHPDDVPIQSVWSGWCRWKVLARIEGAPFCKICEGADGRRERGEDVVNPEVPISVRLEDDRRGDVISDHSVVD